MIIDERSAHATHPIPFCNTQVWSYQDNNHIIILLPELSTTTLLLDLRMLVVYHHHQGSLHLPE